MAQESAISRYINLNDAPRQKVYEIYEKKLGLEYHDHFGQWKEVPLTIKNWKNEIVVQMKLEKSFGLNHHLINLDNYSSKWELNKIYFIEMLFEQNEKIELQFKLVENLVKTPPSIDVVVNPVQFSCDLQSSKLIEFYGVVSGGRAPYTVQWYILNSAKNDFLYQPKQEIISTGKTSLIKVDKSPSYYVVIYVMDACGGLEKKMVYVACDNSKNKINTIFVEPLNKSLIDQINANKS
ncbi:MAG: hypothetical protein ACKO96_45200 [Flammeovirgaceae bacterium]